MRSILLLAALALPAVPVPAPVVDAGPPVPPYQHKPWSPPKADVADAFVTAAALMFEHGFADPRGCEYRAVVFTAPDFQNAEFDGTRTHAWLLPASPASCRYAVGWDGLIYPVAQIGPFADLHADVRAAIKRHVEASGEDADEYGERAQALYRPVNVSPRHNDWLADAAVALLLRLGEGELAADLRGTSQPSIDPKTAEDPYLNLAPTWAEKVFDRALAAHTEGDDRAARSGFRMLLTAAPAIDAEARRRGWKPSRNRNRGARPSDQFEQLAALLFDQDRRAVAAPHDPIVCIGPGRHPNAKRRIAALIDRLENATAQRWGYENSAGWAGDAVMDALAREGDAAIEPLLKCLETDDRLTRMIHYNQGWGCNLQSEANNSNFVLTVRDAAVGVLARSDYYPTNAALVETDEPYAAQVAAIRARLARPEAKQPLVERWYRRLADDDAGIDEWCRAAGSLVERQQEVVRDGWTSRYGYQSIGKAPTLVGDPLRGRAGTSVSDLLVRRIRQAESPVIAANLAMNLVAWDPAAAKPLLRPLTARCRDAGHLSSALQLIDARVTAGDTTALDEYAAWITDMTDDQENNVGNPFTLMVAHPEHPSIARAAEKLFGDPKSPRRPAITPNDTNRFRNNMWSWGLLQFPAYRTAVLEMLREKAAVGVITVNEQTAMIQMGNWSEGRNLDGTDAPQLYEGPFRGCDFVAFQLAGGIPAAPRFELYWPEAKRDAVLAATVAFVEGFGPRIDVSGGIRFPPRDRPATRDEVRRHEAIFSLESDGPARVVKLPERPQPAQWITLHEIPTEGNRYRAGRYVQEKGFLQDGQVWQAEEVRVDGRWRRFYGFTGAHRVAKAPAEEIEFPAQDYEPWLRYAGKLEARLAPPPGTIDPDQPGPPRLLLGGAVPVPLKVRNAGGLPADVPTLAGRARLRAWYSPEVIAPQGMLAPAAKTEAGWEELPAKPGAEFPNVAGLSLEAATDASAGDIDLSKWFDLSRPGFYRVKLTATGAADDGSGMVVFSLGMPPAR